MSAEDCWFANCVNRAFECEDKRTAVELIENRFDRQEIEQYLRRQNWKVQLKWMALNHPTLNSCIQIAKKMLHR